MAARHPPCRYENPGQDRDAMDELARIELDEDGPLRVVRLSGEIDISNADDLETRLRAFARGAGFRLDLSGVSYVDSAGVRLLFHLAAAVPGLRLSLGEASPVRRVLEVAAADQLLLLEGSPAEEPRGRSGRAA
jgi:anti-anti-sigma factor